jgi:hypothetical protein
MIKLLMPLALLAGVMTSAAVCAAPPKDATGQCKDGSYTSAENKRGACSDHGGVKDWYGTKKSAREDKRTSKSDARDAKRSEAPRKADSRADSRPNDATGRCSDGSYTAAESRQGACSAHGGVKDWFAKEQRSESRSAAAGGSASRVWVNTESKVYHCRGDRWYGKTQRGEYMSESEAKSSGNRADHGKTCNERN